MDERFFKDAMSAVGITPIVIDENTDFSKLGNPFEKPNYAIVRAGIMSSPATSYWLKAAIEALEKRDPLDAASDAGFLFGLMEKRAEEALGKGAA